jgi:hypothetical protein
MLVQDVTTWSVGKYTTAPAVGACPYAGIAIGPESDEGLVRVNGVLLQAGRVLPLPATSYTVERVLGSAGAPLATVAQLQLLLFEHPGELGVDVSRPNGLYGVKDAAAVSDTVYAQVARVPFIGRRQARVNILASAAPASGTHKYKIIGRSYSVTTRTVTEHELAVDEAFEASDRASFYVGGTNESESWHELSFLVVTGDGAAITCDVDVETIGEAR